LIRIPEVFADLRPDILAAVGASSCKDLGAYCLIRLPPGITPRGGPAGIFIPWCLPVGHAWPCDPGKVEGFIEKAAQALARKFSDRNPRSVWVGVLRPGPGDAWFKRLASNMRGRCLQLFPDSAMPLAAAGMQAPDEPALFCMVGAGGLYAGIASPRECNGFYPGGLVHLPKTAEKSISRAGAKIAEALHCAALHGEAPQHGAHWLELGASPGGMTLELLNRGHRVTAIDRAAIDERLARAPGLTFFQQDVAHWRPRLGMTWDALLCDMNDDPLRAFNQVLRLAPSLRNGAWIIFTLKTTGREGMDELLDLHGMVLENARAGGLHHLSTSHLTGNRHEFTLWLRRN
jgi:hypothetical protein